MIFDNKVSSKCLLIFLILINVSIFIAPKLILISFFNQVLWGEITSHNILGAISEDIIFSVLFSSFIFYILFKKVSLKTTLYLLVLAESVLLLLMMDMRVRQLWLKPLDISLISYTLNNIDDLTSGFDLFFKQAAFYSFTFRKLLFFMGVFYAGVWFSAAWIIRKNTCEVINLHRSKSVFITLTLVIFSFTYFDLVAQKYRYRMNENIFVSIPLSKLRSFFTQEDKNTNFLADNFEQKQSPINFIFSSKRTILKDIKPFDNVVVIVYESMRWRDINILGEGKTLSPVLSQMAANGMVSKCFVSVPHSSKAYFAILTGRHPYPGIEMKEVANDKNETIWHYLNETKQIKTVAYSSLNLGFEGMGKMLKSFGIESYQASNLAKEQGIGLDKISSFGTSDEDLYRLGSRKIAASKSPFFAVFFPITAHYPYHCKTGNSGQKNYADYQACVKESDNNLGILLSEFKRLNLTKNTLFVIVGDHGESFGEHGLFVHNSSMYDEEVSAPLVFWSEDGRLKSVPLGYSRQIDIVPTIADLLNLEQAHFPVQGKSLLRQDSLNQPVFMSTFFDGLASALVEPPYKYIYEHETGKLLRFSQENDFFEKNPLIIDGLEKQAIVKRIQSFIAYQEKTFSETH